MTRMRSALPFLVATLCPLGALGAEPAYRDNHDVHAALKAAVSKGGDMFSLESLPLAPAKGSLPVVRIGSKRPDVPAMLVVAGLDGRDLLGTEMAVSLVESLAAQREETAKLLAERALYVIARVNEDGAAAAFAKPRREQAGLAGHADSDHDTLQDEDRAEDLDGDDQISWIRVEDPEGTMVLDGSKGDFLRAAKASEGEKPTHRLFIEGIDSDHDELWNEEEDNGVNLARNFPHGYDWFARDVGRHQVSEPPSRAVADFLLAHPNIGVLLSYGYSDNLLTSPPRDKTSSFDPGGPPFGRKPVELPNEKDLPYLAHEGELYRKDLGIEKEVSPASAGPASKGSLASYFYYGRGRAAYSTPPWCMELQLAWNDRAKGEKDKKPEPPPKKPVDETIKKQEVFRDWLLKANPSAWLGWKAIQHPDFPGKKAEVGGFAPYSTLLPPAGMLADLATTQTLLAKRLLADLPHDVIREASLNPLGGGVAELRVVVENQGYLPDVLGMGVFSREVRATRVELDPGKGSTILDGPPPFLLKPLAGSGGFEEVRKRILLGDGVRSVDVTVVSEVAGRDTRTVALEVAK